MERGGGIEDFQHCIEVTQGQEERISKTQTMLSIFFLCACHILGFGGIWENVQCVFFVCFGVSLCWGTFVGRALFLSWSHNRRVLVDKRGGIENFQRCIGIIQGQEERTPETPALWALKLSLGRFLIAFI